MKQILLSALILTSVGNASFMANRAKNYFTPSCILVFNQPTRFDLPTEKFGDVCQDGRLLVKHWTENISEIVEVPNVCSVYLQAETVDCNALCPMGGLCLTRSVDCQGEETPSGGCSCDLKKKGEDS